MNPDISTITEENPGSGLEAICQNRTLIIDKYKGDQSPDDLSEEPDNLFKEATKMEDVFKHYRPAVNVAFKDAGGNDHNETLKFDKLKDFEADGGEGNLVMNSEFLSSIKQKIDLNSKVLDKLRGNKKLQTIINDPDAKKELITMLEGMIKELKQSNE